MRKAITFIVSVVYLFFSVGATLHEHYCMGEHVGTSLFSFKDRVCGKCGMEKHAEESNGCCKDVIVTVKSTDPHALPTFYDCASPLLHIIDIAPFITHIKINLKVTDRKSLAHAPPLILIKPLFIQYRSFRI